MMGLGTGEDDKKEKVETIDRPDPNEYILTKNPKYSPAGGGPGIGPPEPEYIWVKRQDAPFTADAFISRKTPEASAAEAKKFEASRPPEAAEKPRPDQRFFLSPEELKEQQARQGQAAAPPGAAPRRAASRPADPGLQLRPSYGYVVLVQGKRIYTDLAEPSGVAAGNTLIVYREGEELKHPVSGAPLGRADEEIARVKVVEVGEKTSIAEIVSVAEGAQIHTSDKVKLLRAN
jgi:hypothetical protein